MSVRCLTPAAAAALALSGLPATSALAEERAVLQARVDAVRAALAEAGGAEGDVESQSPNWTNWPKWTKWANWANK